MNKIVPTTLAKDLTKFEEDLKKVEAFAGKVQMDIIDGKFAPVETVAPEVLLSLETGLEVEAHLMVEEPKEWIERCVTAGITAVYGQVEKMTDKMEFIFKAEEAGMRTGLAFDLDTPLIGLEEWVNLVDSVLLMGVKAGAQGQTFERGVLEKIKKVREMSPSVTIMIDGGLNEINIKKCLEVGGDKMEFAVGSVILNDPDPETVYRRLENVDNN
jgi:ribulose-phosphate 3-epimerase